MIIEVDEVCDMSLIVGRRGLEPEGEPVWGGTSARFGRWLGTTNSWEY